MSVFSVGPIRLEVEHRNPGADGGPTLRVRDAERGREWLRFDCFASGGHWHLDPAGRDQISPFEAGLDSLAWTLAQLRADCAGLLARAGFEAGALDPRALAGALDSVERAMRNPPVDLDAVRPSARRPSRGEKWTTYPDDVLPLWVADMDFPIAEPIRRVLRFAVERSDLGYPIHPAPTPIPDLTAARMQRLYGWSVAPERVEVLSDVVQGMYTAVHQFSEPGDGIVVQTPIYPPFLGSVAKQARRLDENPLALTARGYVIDLDALRRGTDARTRILLLCNPHNPTGRAFRRDELEPLAALAVERGWWVVADEVHQDLVFPGHRHVPFASLGPEIAARTITLTAASKAFNIAGLRCAVAIFGSDEAKRRFDALPRHIRGGIGMLGIEALDAAWRDSEPWLDAVRAYLAANRAYVIDTVREEMPGVVLHPPEATYLAWLDFRALDLRPSPFAFFLEQAKVALSDGATFGAPGRGFARINFATSRAILSDALERIAKALR
ncbi:MAG: pyridoxal phosphate-dependent aminotransferase [Deltaproteobacteria bacterium]|nr:MAG: pyridoxal phosphate-dependent aminotransferase [Deltaproteobacteria bacterium]